MYLQDPTVAVTHAVGRLRSGGVVAANSIIGGGPGWGGYRYYEETLRSMLPAMEALGVATAAEVDIDTLAVRLEAEAVQLDSTLMFSTWIGAWARKR